MGGFWILSWKQLMNGLYTHCTLYMCTYILQSYVHLYMYAWKGQMGAWKVWIVKRQWATRCYMFSKFFTFCIHIFKKIPKVLFFLENHILASNILMSTLTCSLWVQHIFGCMHKCHVLVLSFGRWKLQIHPWLACAKSQFKLSLLSVHPLLNTGWNSPKDFENRKLLNPMAGFVFTFVDE
jgi:hypothetical protein